MLITINRVTNDSIDYFSLYRLLDRHWEAVRSWFLNEGYVICEQFAWGNDSLWVYTTRRRPDSTTEVLLTIFCEGKYAP